MKLKVFTQPSCPKCPAAKKVVEQFEDKLKVEYYDIKTEDGLAEALSHDIMSTPSVLVIDDKDRVIKEWVGQSPNLDELSKIVK
ncbi:MAG: thioredoxin family protein [Candidatus Woesearchaeota archaeon]